MNAGRAVYIPGLEWMLVRAGRLRRGAFSADSAEAEREPVKFRRLAGGPCPPLSHSRRRTAGKARRLNGISNITVCSRLGGFAPPSPADRRANPAVRLGRSGAALARAT